MTNHPPLPGRILHIAFRLSERTASPAEMKVLEDWMMASPEHPPLYVQLVSLFAGLEWERGENQRDAVGLVQSPSVTEEDWPVGDSIGTDEAPALAEDVLSDQVLSLSPPKGWLQSVFSGESVVGGLLVAAVCVAFVGLATEIMWRRHRPVVDSQVSIARLTQSVDCVWSTNSDVSTKKGSSASFESGDTLDVASGVAEITFVDGARLTLEGPTRVVLHSAQQCVMQSGRLVALVPPPAVGFVVQTPRSSIVDLGTEFGVAVNDDDSDDVVVFRGEVEVSQRVDAPKPDARRDASAPVRLKAGQSRHIARDSTRSPEQSPKGDVVFVRNAATAKAAKQKGTPRVALVSNGKPASASSFWANPDQSNDTFPPENVVDGRFDDTDINGKHSWWMAADRVPADLTIDLEAIHDVVQVRLQNAHGHRHDRGARLVRLSVSSDGENFVPAGEIELPDAAHRETIEIQRVAIDPPLKARFVRLEVPTYYGQGAALNEVQVFARAEQKK